MSLQVIAIACDWGAAQPGGVAGVHSWYALGLYYKHLAWIEAEHVWFAPAQHKPLWIETGRHVYARRLDAWEGFARQLEEQLSTLPLHPRNLILTGDHSWAGRILPTLSRRFERLGVIWIDAHADFHNPATTPSGNLHGMSLAMATALNTERFHPIPAFTWQQWEKLVEPAIAPENLLFIGLRSHEPPEAEILERHQIPVFSAAALARDGIASALSAAHALIERCDAVYISLDVDVWDPSFARGTSTPVPGGLSIAQVRAFLQEILLHEKVRFVEVTEINPLLDRDNQTALFAYGTIRPYIDGTMEGSRGGLE